MLHSLKMQPLRINRLSYRLVLFIFTFLIIHASQAQTVQLSKSADSPTAESGTVIQYSLEIGCSSLVGDCEGAILEDTLPEGTSPDVLPAIIINSASGPVAISPTYDANTRKITWDFTSLPENGLPAGASAVVTFNVNIDAGSIENQTLVRNSAILLSDGNDAPSTADVEVTATPQWTASKQVTSGPIYQDQEVTYQIDLCRDTEIGNLNLTNVTFTDILPAGADFVSATDGGVHDGGDPGIVTWNYPELLVTDGCKTVEVVVTYPSSDMVENNTGLSTTIPKSNQVSIDATPIGEAPINYTASADSPLLPPVFQTGIGKMAADDGTLPLMEINHFAITVENGSTVPVDEFKMSDSIPNQYDLTEVQITPFNSSLEPYDLIVHLNGSSTPILWQTGQDPTVLANFDVTTIPGYMAGDYVSEVIVNFGLVPAGFGEGSIKLLVTPAYDYDAMTMTATDNMGNPVSLYTPYENTAKITGIRTQDGMPMDTLRSFDHMCFTDRVARLDPQKSVRINYVDQPAGEITTGNPYFQGSRITYTVRIENDGSDEVASDNTGAIAFEDLINPIGSDLLPADVTYIPNSWSILSNTSSLTLDEMGTNLTFEEIDDFNSSGRKLLRWSVNGNLLPGEYIELEFDATINNVPAGTVITNDFCTSSASSDFICDEDECGETSTTGLNDFFNTSSNSGTVITGVNEMCCKNISITVRDETPVMKPEKGVVSAGPYAPTGTDVVELGLAADIVQYEVSFGNDANANIELQSPSGYDLLPSQLEYVPGSLVLFDNTTGLTLDATGGNPTFEVIDDFDNTGRQLLRWEFTGEFPIDKGVVYRFDTRIKAGEEGSPENSVYMNTDGQAYDCNSFVVDVNDFDGDGDRTETICKSDMDVSIEIEQTASLNITKFVQGANDNMFLELPDIGSTNPGDGLMWKFNIFNPGNVTMTDVVVYDIFPYEGDVGVQLNNSPRETEWTPFLSAPITPPVGSGITVFYSESTDPCRDEINPIVDNSGSCVNDWTSTPPADLSLVKAVRFDLANPLLPNDSINVFMDMTAPSGDVAPSGSIAWNSLARNANEVPAQEPNKVGIALEYPDLALRKTLKSGQASTIDVGDEVTFTIRVINQGVADAHNIEITDYIPSGTSLADADWDSVDALSATYDLAFLAAGASTNIDITLVTSLVNLDTDVTNNAEISNIEYADGSPFQDYDSTQDNIPNNDGTATDNAIDNRDGDQDDADFATFTVAPCEITDLGIQTICNDDGSPYLIEDDTYTILIQPTGTSLGSTYSVTGDINASNLAFGPGQSIGGIYSVPNDAPLTITVTADETGCVLADFVIPVPVCSADCQGRTICLPVGLSVKPGQK